MILHSTGKWKFGLKGIDDWNMGSMEGGVDDRKHSGK